MKCASTVTHKYITKSDDEWSVVLSAFAQAIDNYNIGKGSFYSFAELVIRRRLIDYVRSVAEARELGVTPGKLNLVEKLQASATDIEDINVEEWLTKSVKEIMKETKANRQAKKTQLVGEPETETDEEEIDVEEIYTEEIDAEEIDTEEIGETLEFQEKKEVKIKEKSETMETKAEVKESSTAAKQEKNLRLKRKKKKE